MLVGWHFLYEGVAKLTNPLWTSAGYLQASQGWFSGFFKDLATNPGTLSAVDTANQWGLVAIGLALVLGSLVRVAAASGIALLVLYYLAAPPFPGLEYVVPTEGSYLFVNKVLVEIGALLVIFTLPTSHRIGLDRLIRMKRRAPLPADLATEEGR
jgi:thiosulfate dehydrogenase [quinone] large subunit